jgi:hypothetical protein
MSLDTILVVCYDQRVRGVAIVTSLLVNLPTADGMQVWMFVTNRDRVFFAAGSNYNEAKNLAKWNLYPNENLRESGRETIPVLLP